MNKQKAFAEAQTQYHVGSSKKISMEYEHNTQPMKACILYQCQCSGSTNRSSMHEEDSVSNPVVLIQAKVQSLSQESREGSLVKMRRGLTNISNFCICFSGWADHIFQKFSKPGFQSQQNPLRCTVLVKSPFMTLQD